MTQIGVGCSTRQRVIRTLAVAPGTRRVNDRGSRVAVAPGAKRVHDRGSRDHRLEYFVRSSFPAFTKRNRPRSFLNRGRAVDPGIHAQVSREAVVQDPYRSSSNP